MKTRFYFNKKLDRQMISEFIKIDNGGGINFAQGIFKIHPRLKPLEPSNDKLNNRDKALFLKEYLDFYYNKNGSSMLHKIDSIKKAWKKKENKYITITEEFFEDFDFSKSDYIAYASIINCNPRFLESKTFQFFYKKSTPDAIHTIAHEILHFIFFDFIEEKMKKEIKHLSEDQIWDLSEIFNTILLSSSRYQKIINKKFIIVYPDHKHYIPLFKKAYKNSTNARDFIIAGINIILRKKK
jgi:hypothetical protein